MRYLRSVHTAACIVSQTPRNTIHLPDDVLVLDQRLRRCSSTNTSLGFVFAELGLPTVAPSRRVPPGARSQPYLTIVHTGQDESVRETCHPKKRKLPIRGLFEQHLYTRSVCNSNHEDLLLGPRPLWILLHPARPSALSEYPTTLSGYLFDNPPGRRYVSIQVFMDRYAG